MSQIKSSPDGRPQVYRVNVEMTPMQFMMVGVTNTNPADPTYPLWYVGQSIPQLQTLWHRIMMPPQSNPFQPQPG